MTTCDSCGAAVFWVTMPSGKRMPVDAEPHPDGNIEVSGTAGRVVKMAKGQRDLFLSLYRSHFSTCPNAASHRRTK